MKKASIPSVCLALAILLSFAANAAAQGKTLTIPKGTKIDKLGPGSFKLTTPDGLVLKITSYQKAAKSKTAGGGAGILGDCGTLGDCGIYDAKGKLVASGANGVLKHVPQAAKALKDVPPGDYVKIDDEVTWLPATIRFPSLRVFNRQELMKLSPQPDPPGQVR
jgi:hypothetical protein